MLLHPARAEHSKQRRFLRFSFCVSLSPQDHSTTHREKNLLSPLCHAIMVKIEYPGVVQLIERAVWDREARGFEPHHSDQKRPCYQQITGPLNFVCPVNKKSALLSYYNYPKSTIISSLIIFANFPFNLESFCLSNKTLYP